MERSGFGARLRRFRRRAGVSQAKLATVMGLSNRHQVGSIEGGQRQLKANELVAALGALGVSLEEFSNPYLLEENVRFTWRLNH